MSHATSNAETLEHFATLQKAHDALYKEHVHLQEQMDDAVELLKYLKEEKSSNELQIGELETRIVELREMNVGSVVSMTIENLTKDKMELEMMIDGLKSEHKEALRTVEEMRSKQEQQKEKVRNLEVIKEAYELQTRQHLASGEKITALETERRILLSKVEDLEREGARMEEQTKQMAEDQARRYEEQVRLVAQLRGELVMKNGQVSREEEIGRLKTLVGNLEGQLKTKNEQLACIDEELGREKEEMQSHLDSLRLQLSEFREASDQQGTQLQQHQQPSQSSTENPQSQQPSNQDLLIENESLQYQIQNLQAQLLGQSESAAQKEEIHAQLEKEMQERLAKRLAMQLQQSEAAMEARVRRELEEEYRVQNHQDQPMQQRSKSFHTSSKSVEASTNSSSVQNELEDQLRKQLHQVKEERERWQHEQEQFQQKVLLSQQQLDKIREGYRSKVSCCKYLCSSLSMLAYQLHLILT